MDRPDISRRQVVDRFFYDYGFHVRLVDDAGGEVADAPASGSGFCGLEWQPLRDGRLLVIAYEHPDNQGRSVTNAAEDIARQFAELAGVELDRLVWVESYGATYRKDANEWDRCIFKLDAAGRLDENATDWKPMRPDDWTALGIERPTVPTLARRSPG